MYVNLHIATNDQISDELCLQANHSSKRHDPTKKTDQYNYRWALKVFDIFFASQNSSFKVWYSFFKDIYIRAFLSDGHFVLLDFSPPAEEQQSFLWVGHVNLNELSTHNCLESFGVM